MVQRIDPALERKLREHPNAVVRLIVRVTGEATEARSRLRGLGAVVHRSFVLVPGFAVSCSSSTAIRLLREPWVVSIEEDRVVSAQSRAARRPGKGKS